MVEKSDKSKRHYHTIGPKPTRSFSITVGLREGYGKHSSIHSVSQIEMLIKFWIKKRKSQDICFLSGIVTEGSVLYGSGSNDAESEPVGYFTGEVDPLRDSLFSDEEIVEALNELADLLGSELEQKHVYVRFNGEVWVRERVDYG